MRSRPLNRVVLLVALAGLLVTTMAPAQAWTEKGLPTGGIVCDVKPGIDVKPYQKISIVDKDTGKVLSAQVMLTAAIDAKVVICVKVNASVYADVAAVVTIGDPIKKDGGAIEVPVFIKANVDVTAKVNVKVKAQVGLTVALLANVDASVPVKKGDTKECDVKKD